MGEGALMVFISNVKSTKKLWLQTGKPSHFDQWNLKLLGKENGNSVPCGMRRLIYNTSTFSTTLKFVNSWGVHCFFLHVHLPSFIQKIFTSLNFLFNNEQFLLSLNPLRQAVILLLPLFRYPLKSSLIVRLLALSPSVSLYRRSIKDSVN